MSSYGAYVGKRLAQFVLVIFIGLNIAFFVTHLTPIDPVEESISVSELSQAMGVKASDLIRKLMQAGKMATINQQIDADTAFEPDVVVSCADLVTHGTFVEVIDEAKGSGAAQVAVMED